MATAAAKREFLTSREADRVQKEFKIPVDSFNPGTYWVVSLDRESFMPTRKELLQLRSYCEFVARRIYSELYARDILNVDLPRCPGHNTSIFRKGLSRATGTEKQWFYRKITWRSGPMYAPDPFGDNYKPHTLVELLDMIEALFPEKWQAWKQKHPEIFSE